MQTIIVRGGWRAWALVIVGGALLLVVGLTVGMIALGVLAVVGALILGQRALHTIGLGGKPAAPPTPTGGHTESGAVIDGEFQVVSRQTGNRTLTEPDQ